MKRLYLLYDERCGLCRRLKEWLLQHEAWLELVAMPAGSPQAAQMFPELKEIASSEDLVVVSDEGEVYLNNHAWIMCLYALREYRSWAYRLSHPLLMPFARQASESLSRDQRLISRWLGSGNIETIANELRQVTLEPCSPTEGTI